MISVCMASRNSEKFIKQQIESILCQLNENDELIISDDNSSDNTILIIEAICDSRIKLVHHEPSKKKFKNGAGFYYATANFENALKFAKGDIVFLSDHDDIWEKGKVKICLNELRDADFVMSNFSLINENGLETNPKYLDFDPLAGGILKTIFVAKMQGCTMAFKRNVLEIALPFPKNLMLHDAWIGLMAKKHFKVKFIDLPLIKYRRTGENVSTSAGKSNNPIWFRLFYRIKILFQLNGR